VGEVEEEILQEQMVVQEVELEHQVQVEQEILHRQVHLKEIMVEALQ
jgi:hypothetical protein